jgi:hypothetical protein
MDKLKRGNGDDYHPDDPFFKENIDALMERARRNEINPTAEEETEEDLVRAFVDRPPSPTTDLVMQRCQSERTWPDVAYERAERFRGDFELPPKEEWLDRMEEGAVECKTTIQDPRIRIDRDPKPDDPPSKVIIFCFRFYSPHVYHL